MVEMACMCGREVLTKHLTGVWTLRALAHILVNVRIGKETHVLVGAPFQQKGKGEKKGGGGVCAFWWVRVRECRGG